MTTPTLINLPPAPSNPDTPSEMGPGTPNSGTTSLSTLSTTAIKDGHRGHPSAHVVPPGMTQTSASSTTNVLEAERADRISRLAGLDRVAAVRSSTGSAAVTPNPPSAGASVGYFDPASGPVKERSTVGSASATGSVGGRTTWASSSDVYDGDKMSEDHEDGVSSTGALSDEGSASVIGVGEGASSTISGSTSSLPRGQPRPGRSSSPGTTRGVSGMLGYGSQLASDASNAPSSPVAGTPTATASPHDPRRDPQMIDGMTYDPEVVDTVTRPPPPLQAAPGTVP